MNSKLLKNLLPTDSTFQSYRNKAGYSIEIQNRGRIRNGFVVGCPQNDQKENYQILQKLPKIEKSKPKTNLQLNINSRLSHIDIASNLNFILKNKSLE